MPVWVRHPKLSPRGPNQKEPEKAPPWVLCPPSSHSRASGNTPVQPKPSLEHIVVFLPHLWDVCVPCRVFLYVYADAETRWAPGPLLHGASTEYLKGKSLQPRWPHLQIPQAASLSPSTGDAPGMDLPASIPAPTLSPSWALTSLGASGDGEKQTKSRNFLRGSAGEVDTEPHAGLRLATMPSRPERRPRGRR